MTTGHSLSVPNRVKNLVGRSFGRLTVIGYAGARKSGHYWICRCRCGNQKSIFGGNLTKGYTQSCGCLHSEISALRCAHRAKHGKYKTPEWESWASMRRRCLNPKHRAFGLYGGRGIRICRRWSGNRGFQNFLADMGLRPSDAHSLDRIDNNGNYAPGNCRWAVQKQQSRNKGNNHFLEFQNETLTVQEWAERLGINHITLRARIRSGWSVVRALTEPIDIKKGRKQPAPTEALVERL